MDTYIEYPDEFDASALESFLQNHPDAALYHNTVWLSVIRGSYGQKGCVIVCRDGRRILGLLPVTIFRGLSLKKNLISMPYFDMGGLLANSADAEQALIHAAMRLGRKTGAQAVELRQTRPVTTIEDGLLPDISWDVKTGKVRMVLELPSSAEILMKSFKSKLRSQIKRPVKAGLYAAIGGIELLDDFYQVFVRNMRDLGSPVHSKRLMANVLKAFTGNAKVTIIYKERTPVACSMVIGFRDILENPWSSSLREYGNLSPNMLLYWTMLEYACDSGYRYFDFGRSTPGEGTHKFKEQWGAVARPLYWYTIPLRNRAKNAMNSGTPDKSKYSQAIEYWRQLPTPVTQIAGPFIRKYIAL